MIAYNQLNKAFVILVYAFILLPVVFVVYVSFFRSQFLTFPPPGYTLHWFSNALSQKSLVNGFITSTEVGIIAATIGVTIGTLGSIALVQYNFPGRSAVHALLVSPLVVPGIVIGTALYIFYIQLAQSIDWDPTRNLSGLVFAHTMLTIPWSVRLVTANLGMLDPSIEEAAKNLGANTRTTFLRITLPRMRPGIVAASLFSFIISFENLEVSLLLVSPDNTTLPIAMMQYLRFDMDPTIAAASTIQIAIIGILLLVTDRFVSLSQVV